MARRLRWHSVIIIVLVLLIALAACDSVDPVVKVGLVAPFEGAERDLGYDVLYSARMAVREVNNSGGIGGYRVALVSIDDSGDLELARLAAESMVLDQDIVAVVGHWLPETTETSTATYERSGLALLPGGSEPFNELSPSLLPLDFKADYEAVTPFDEEPGPYAAASYDAFQLIWLAMEEMSLANNEINRSNILNQLKELEYSGMTGTVYMPDN